MFSKFVAINNMIKIQDIIVPTKGTAKYFNIIALNFPMNPTSVTFYWQIFSETEDEDGVKIPGTPLMDGNLTMDQETYANWGSDDSYVTNWACNKLDLTII
jgi:hypothetical protein